MSQLEKLVSHKEALLAAEDYLAAISTIEQILAIDSNAPKALLDLGRSQLQAGFPAEALETFSDVSPKHSDYLAVQLVVGHAHKALNDSDAAATAYRSMITDENPYFSGVAFWSLADLKTRPFSSEEISALEQFIDRFKDQPEVRYLADFAMIKVLESRGEYEHAFMSAQRANNIAWQLQPFDPSAFQQFVMQSAQIPWHSKVSSSDAQPIFIVGMHRSGSTLLEQILAAHSAIEATDELPYIRRFAHGLEQASLSKGFADLDQQSLDEMAQRYLEQAQAHQPHFAGALIDKEPTNFLHIGLIFALFPKAKVINIVRDPRDNAMAVYKQFFAKGNEYTNALEGIAFYWQGYATLMRRWQSQYGSRIHHISYETLTDTPEAEIDRLFAYLDKPLEQACLKFYESERPVLTPSSGQVRQPINKRSVGSWKKYEQALGQHAQVLTQIKQVVDNLFFKA
ncbi:tetratricopeptide repeat-containing sulfotransferase family protein [uncultured Umboniibacter sp.]|uniref:tetratricopeptide repeat-containing sulfotransferase family protein n=1 Tax=uncultured Umboniibacter sp. TaxID=1798917 RepID=UPI0026148E2E|nr:tetratricopeptide repeat-containing sulfotransferase family protein [uncultured Umboniibacter sp.]